MIEQKIRRFSIYGHNSEVVEMAPNVWVVIYHNINTDLRASVYAGTSIHTSEADAITEAKVWLEICELENQK